MALLQIIDGLPAASRYAHALVTDPVTAAEIAETPQAQDPGDWEPGWEWRAPAVSMLAELWDLYVSAHSDGRAEKWPRPRSLVADLVRESDHAANEAFLDDVMSMIASP